MSSEDSSTGHRVLLVTENYRLQSIVGYNAVPIITGKKPASNPILTAGSLVTEFFPVTEEIAGDKLVGQETSSKNSVTNWLQSLPTGCWLTQHSLTVASQERERYW